MKTVAVIVSGILALSLYSCSSDEDTVNEPIGEEGVELTYDFESNDEGWNAALVDYPLDDEDLYEFDVEHTDSPVDGENGALKLSASNPNDKLFMYASKQISGLEPSTRYQVSYSVDIASVVVIDTTMFVSDTTAIDNDTTNVDEVFTSYNDTVVVKAGALSEEPATETTADNFLELIGIDIGEDGVDGTDLVVIGTFPADTTDTDVIGQTFTNTSPITVFTNDDGDLWLLIGTEAFATQAEIYLNSINVLIER